MVSEKRQNICLCKPNGYEWRMVTVTDPSHTVHQGGLWVLCRCCQVLCFVTSSHKAAWDYKQTWNCWHCHSWVCSNTCAVYTTELSCTPESWFCVLWSCWKLIVRQEQVYSISFSRLSDFWIPWTNVYFQNILGSVFQGELEYRKI